VSFVLTGEQHLYRLNGDFTFPLRGGSETVSFPPPADLLTGTLCFRNMARKLDIYP